MALSLEAHRALVRAMLARFADSMFVINWSSYAVLYALDNAAVHLRRLVRWMMVQVSQIDCDSSVRSSRLADQPIAPGVGPIWPQCHRVTLTAAHHGLSPLLFVVLSTFLLCSRM